MAKDFYESLGVSKKASADEIKQAHRKLVRKYHPDRNPDDSAAEDRFKEVQQAYDTLSDPEKRKAYDRGGMFGGMGSPGGGRAICRSGRPRRGTFHRGHQRHLLLDLQPGPGRAAGTPRPRSRNGCPDLLR